MQNSDISDERKEYSKDTLNEVASCPFTQFDLWYTEVKKSDELEPNAMVLATLSSNNSINQRTVLMKFFSKEGFTFFTNYTSRKARDIANSSNVSLHFLWKTVERQVNIVGTARKLPASESEDYFRSRPRESQIGAWVSFQSSVISSREVLKSRYAYIENKFMNQDIPYPEFWGGYKVIPESLEFWQGGEARLHDRFIYKKIKAANLPVHNQTPIEKEGWSYKRLSP